MAKLKKLAFIFCCCLPVLPVQADETKVSQTQMDYYKLLFGTAKKVESQDQTAIENDTAFRLAAQKLQAGYKLSADEYRALGVGCVGYESYRRYFQNKAVVTAVYRDSPAAKAGIKVGDQIIDEMKDNEHARVHPNIKQVQFRLARVGDPVEVTLLRNGEPVRITLSRMNIADIKESKYRRMWERTIRNLGYPKEGVFTGTNLHNLSVDGPPQ